MPRLLIALLVAAGIASAGTSLAADRTSSTSDARAPASGTTMSKDAYRAEKDRIDAAYKQDKERCDGLKANAKDVCNAEAKGRRDVARAELDARNRNTPKARHDARVAKADADYNVAKEKCDDLRGNEKDVCVKDAKARHVRARADAKVDRVAAEHPADAGRVAEAKRDAAEDRREADYKAAAEKCDARSGEARHACLRDVRARYGKS